MTELLYSYGYDINSEKKWWGEHYKQALFYVSEYGQMPSPVDDILNTIMTFTDLSSSIHFTKYSCLFILLFWKP